MQIQRLKDEKKVLKIRLRDLGRDYQTLETNEVFMTTFEKEMRAKANTTITVESTVSNSTTNNKFFKESNRKSFFKSFNKKANDTSLNFSTVSNFLSNKKGFSSKTIDIINTINDFEQKEFELQNISNKMRKKEMDRLFKEFVVNDYERRFQTTKEIVISALLGEDYTPGELNRQAKERKVKKFV